MYLSRKFDNFHSLFVIVVSFFVSGISSEKDITINVPPGSEECFFETIKSGQVIDIDYQVIDGGMGALDISFYLESPSGRNIVMDYKKPEKSHRIAVDEDGDYKLCFDNRFSSFNKKTVYFELIVEGEDGNDVDMWDVVNNPLLEEEEFEIAVQDIEESINKVKAHVLKIRHLQETVRADASRDINVLYGNFFKVNYWSIMQIFIIIIVGMLQVVTVKSLFDEKSKIHKFWKKSFS